MNPIRVFYCYASEDEKLRRELEKHLHGLQQADLITTWYDRRLQAGINWKKKVDKRIESADLIVLLISNYFLQSAYPLGIEMQKALKRNKAEENRIIPVLLSPISSIEWEKTPFNHLPLLPTGRVPVTEWQERDEAFLNVVEGMRKAVTTINISSLVKSQLSLNNQDQQQESTILGPTDSGKSSTDKLPGYRLSNSAEIAKVLEKRKRDNHSSVLLLGSRAGALFRSKHLFNVLHQFSHRNFSRLSHTEQFEDCFTILTRIPFSETEIHALLRSSLQDSVLTGADICLAELIRQGHFDEIITTNIDDVLEQSLSQAEMREYRDFEISIPISSNQVHERSLPVRITKVFGDFNFRRYTVTQRFASINDNLELKSFLQHFLSRDILVVGIDPIWDKEILLAISRSTGTMYFVNEEDLTQHELISKLLRERQAQYILASYDDFIRELYDFLYGGMPINYQVAHNIFNQLSSLSSQISDLSSKMRVLLDRNEALLSEIQLTHDENKRLQNKINALSPEQE